MAFDTEAYFNNLDMFSIRLGLDAVKELAELAGHPEKELKFIHIAGTNGKGSTGAMLEKAFRSCGMKTAFYTSPHLIDIRERFRINGKTVSRELFNETGEFLYRRCQGKKFSYFEFATVLAMLIFKTCQVDIVIWETGMGGRLDATNMVTPECSVITNIALDHQGHLGNTIAEIAGEKAGIIKPGVPVFCGNLHPDAGNVIEKRCKANNSELFFPREKFPEKFRTEVVNNIPVQKFLYDNREISLALPGKMQRKNFQLVYEILSFFSKKWNFNLDTALQGLNSVRWPARFQFIGERIILDGGHNPDGITALTGSLAEAFPEEKFTVLYAAFADKHAENCLPHLEKIAKRFVFTAIPECSRELCSPENLQKLLSGSTFPSEREFPPEKALRKALEYPERVVISGSLYLAGIILKELLPLDQTLDL